MADANQAAAYGVDIVAVPAGEQAPYFWRATSVTHLSQEENQRNHHVYVNVYNADGGELRGAPGLFVNCCWEGQQPGEMCPPAPVTKPSGDMADIPIFPGQKLSVWITSPEGYESELVAGLSTAHPDEGDGNRWGHHSYRVRYDLTAAGAGPIDGTSTEPGPGMPDDVQLSQAELVASLQIIRATVDDILSRLPVKN